MHACVPAQTHPSAQRTKNTTERTRPAHAIAIRRCGFDFMLRNAHIGDGRLRCLSTHAHTHARTCTRTRSCVRIAYLSLHSWLAMSPQLPGRPARCHYLAGRLRVWGGLPLQWLINFAHRAADYRPNDNVFAFCNYAHTHTRNGRSVDGGGNDDIICVLSKWLCVLHVNAFVYLIPLFGGEIAMAVVFAVLHLIKSA